MARTQEELRAGLDYLDAVTTLLHRIRSAHPTKGLYEAADLQWWWRTGRPTDSIGQLFWFDELGRPEAAVILTEWPKRIALDPLVLPDATADMVARVVARGLARAKECGCDAVELEVDPADDIMCEVLAGHGFAVEEAGIVESWLAADARPPVSPLPDGCRLVNRRATPERLHHMIGRSGADVAERLLQTSLYRPELDLLILDGDDNHAAHGLFWFDPETATGLVEPMRTEAGHQRRGLARHVLTTGVELLAAAGAGRIKICFEPDNTAASHLYLSAGFEPVRQTDVYAGRTGA